MTRKAYYAEARRLTRQPRRHRYFIREVTETAAGWMWINGVAYRTASSTLTTVREVDPITESWRFDPPKADFSGFECPDCDCFTDVPEIDVTFGKCEGYLEKM